MHSIGLGRCQNKDKAEYIVQVRILSSAECDLEEAYWFYERQSQGVGTHFLDSLYSDIDSLEFSGGIHRVIFGYHRYISRKFPYAVYYRIDDDVVLVMAVLDCRRDPRWIAERLSIN